MDVAALSLEIDSSSVVEAANDLDKFSVASAKAQVAAGKVSAASKLGNTARMAQDYARAAAKADQMSGAALRAAAANDAVASTSNIAATGLGRQSAANDAVAASSTVAATAAGRQAAANSAVAVTATESAVATHAAGGGLRAAAAGAAALVTGVAASVVVLGTLVAIIAAVVAGAVLFTNSFFSMRSEVGKTTEGLGLTEKQLDRLQKKGIDTGITLGDAFAGLGYAVGAAIKDAIEGPLKGVADSAKKMWDKVVAFSTSALDTIVKTTIGSVAAMVAIWDDIPNIVTDLFYQAVNGVIDAYNAIVQAGWAFFFSIVDTVLGIPGAIGDAFMGGVKLAGSAFDVLVDWSKAAFAGLVDLWNNWPQILGDLFVAGVRAAFATIVWLYEKSRNAIRSLWDGAKALVTGDVGHVANSAAGAAAAGADKATKAFNDAGSAYDRFKAKFAADLKKGTLAAHDSRLRAAAGPAGAGARRGHSGKTDAEKLADIYRNAQAEFTAQENRLKAVGMSARAAAEMEERTKLLNRVQQAGIPVTKAVTAEIERLAGAYADAKVAADTAVAIQGVSDRITKQISSVADETALIGLYGDALERARNELNMLRAAREALPRGEEISSADATRIAEEASKLSRDQQLQGQLRRAEDLRKSSEDAAYAMDLERKGLGLTGEAAIAYAFASERLNAAKRAGTEITPEYLAAINAAGDAYAKQRYAIDQQAQAIADAREVTKGFFSDWINGVRDGGNLFKTFADSVVNSLNRIIDKLLDKTLDGFLDSMFKGGGASSGAGGGGFLDALFRSVLGGRNKGPTGSSGGMDLRSFSGAIDFDPVIRNALGGVYGAAQRFAKGAAFTNTIVSTPTLFRFANGAALGEMGEAGPEAIMPLKRGPNGALGVQAHGGGGGRPVIRMGDIHNSYKLDGAIGADGIAAMVRQGGEATYNQVKRDLQTLLAQLDADGTFAS